MTRWKTPSNAAAPSHNSALTSAHAASYPQPQNAIRHAVSWAGFHVLVILVLVTGCSTTGATDPAPVTIPAVAAPAIRVVDSEEFSAALRAGVFVVNVHVPNEGSLPGTTAMIPFDQLTLRAAELPEDRSAALAVYCKSGRMSAEAVTTLAALGYQNIVELRGGMAAWVAEGRPLAPPSS